MSEQRSNQSKFSFQLEELSAKFAVIKEEEKKAYMNLKTDFKPSAA